MAMVTVMFGEDKLGDHRMTHHPFVVGRDGTCDVTIDNAGISRNHCQFTWDGKRFYVEDLESANGTYHLGHKIRKTAVSDGDKVHIGKFVLVFACKPGETAPAAKSAGTPESAAGGGPATRPGEGSSGVMGLDKTFSMDAKLVLSRMSSPSSGPQRASEVARAFAAADKGPARARTRSRSGLGRVMTFLAILAILGAAVYYALRSLGMVGGIQDLFR